MHKNEHFEGRADRLASLSETSAGTPMGDLLRTFWHPVALATDLQVRGALGLRILSEDLTLYRGESGAVHLIGARCAHRCTVLHTGWVEGEDLRCMYHGWKYNAAGTCIEMPAEVHARPENVSIGGYPVHEYQGLLFAYFGNGPAPDFDLPRKDVLEEPGRIAVVTRQLWDCNFFQQVENSLDATHVSYVHVWGKFSRFGEEITTAIPQNSYEETSAGIRQTARRSETNVRVSDWTFPNNNHVISPGPHRGDPWINTAVWGVPVDDEHTLRFLISSFPSTDPETDARITEERSRPFNAPDHYHTLFGEHRMPESAGPGQVLQLQDYVALRGQGTIANRANEHLGASDAGIAFLRRIFIRELEAARSGEPVKRWSRPARDAAVIEAARECGKPR